MRRWVGWFAGGVGVDFAGCVDGTAKLGCMTTLILATTSCCGLMGRVRSL